MQKTKERTKPMPIIWNLKQWMRANRNIYRANQLCDALRAEAGFKISIQAIHMLINKQPEGLRTLTMQAICTALRCRLSDFFEIYPDGQGNEICDLSKLHSSCDNSRLGTTGPLVVTGDEANSPYLKGYKDGAMTILLRILGPHSPERAVQLLQGAFYAEQAAGEEAVAKLIETIISETNQSMTDAVG
ncbi:MAG TPA: helix-turn-helix domain-containing protein [Pyrinomonadaceae bacterium]